MAAKPALIASGIVGVLVLGTGGYFANEWRACHSLKQDYLDIVYDLRSDARTASTFAAIGAKSDGPARKQYRDLMFKMLGDRARQISERCGDQSYKETAREAEDILVGG